MLDQGIGEKPILTGRIKPLSVKKLPLPLPGEVFCYLLTAAQNNTAVHSKFLRALEQYRDWLANKHARPTRLQVSRFTYNKTAYDNAQLAKPGRAPTASDHDELWYDEAIGPYICDGPEVNQIELAPGLRWCAEMNILPTATNPLSDLQTYAGENSAIFPHAKVALRSVPRMPGEHPRFLYTTGAVTQLNYIQRKAGQKAEHHHVFGALIVEVNSTGDWWVRQLNADKNGCFYDCPGGSVVKVTPDGVEEGHRAEAITWGDVHAGEIDEDVKRICWGEPLSPPGVLETQECKPVPIIDCLRPRYQFYQDLHSQRSQNHHDRSFSRRYEKYVKQQDGVLEELQQVQEFLHLAHRDWCQAVVVNSNHDRHGERWLDEADYKADLPNAKFFLQAQLTRVCAIEEGNDRWSFLEWALRQLGCPEIRFLCIDESFVVGPRHHPVECGLHGDLGPNGARGSTRNLATLGRRNTKGHSHVAEIIDGTYSAGTCQLNFSYNHGPTSWSISHVPCWPNGKRCILTQRAGKYWA